MTKELCHVIEQISREKGISKETMIEALESALLSAMRKKYGGRTNINLTIDRKKCTIRVYETKQVVSHVADPNLEISVSDAAKIDPAKKEGDAVEFELDLRTSAGLLLRRPNRSYSRGARGGTDVIFSGI